MSPGNGCGVLCGVPREKLRCGVRAHELHGVRDGQSVDRDGIHQLRFMRGMHRGEVLSGLDRLFQLRRWHFFFGIGLSLFSLC